MLAIITAYMNWHGCSMSMAGDDVTTGSKPGVEPHREISYLAREGKIDRLQLRVQPPQHRFNGSE